MILKRLVIVVQAKKGAFFNKELTQEKSFTEKPNQENIQEAIQTLYYRGS